MLSIKVNQKILIILTKKIVIVKILLEKYENKLINITQNTEKQTNNDLQNAPELAPSTKFLEPLLRKGEKNARSVPLAVHNNC